MQRYAFWTSEGLPIEYCKRLYFVECRLYAAFQPTQSRGDRAQCWTEAAHTQQTRRHGRYSQTSRQTHTQFSSTARSVCAFAARASGTPPVQYPASMSPRRPWKGLSGRPIYFYLCSCSRPCLSEELILDPAKTVKVELVRHVGTKVEEGHAPVERRVHIALVQLAQVCDEDEGHRQRG